LLRAGRVGRPHGLDGSFHVSEAVPDLLAAAETVVLGEDLRRITRRAGHERRLILRVEGCESRDAAAALRGTELRVARESAPALAEDEWWADDLEGCTVHDGERTVGTVRRLLALPSCEVLEVERGDPAAGALLVPLVSDAVRAVDVGARRIEIDLAFLGEDE
jgi:16S rRNA processing protein RimM